MTNLTEISKSFCAKPFIGLLVDTDQRIKFCCIASGPESLIRLDNGKTPMAGINTLAEAWNSPTMLEIRRKMIKGETVPACKNCVYQESIGKTSNRQHSIIEWTNRLGKDHFDSMIQDTVDNNYFSKENLVYLDLRLGNLCNLKCRMCNPWNSSQIAKEWHEMFNHDDQYTKLWTKLTKSIPPNPIEDSRWYESNFLWDEINNLIPYLKKVYMTGGEPTLIEGNFKFMQSCIDMGYADTMSLFFSVNCTNINNNFLNLIKQFKHVKINASVDGVEKVNDYIRYPSTWNHIDANIKKIAQLDNVQLTLTPTLTLYNVLACDEIFYYANNLSIEIGKSIGIDYLFNSDSKTFLNATLLDLDIRKKLAEKINLLFTEPWIQNSYSNRNSLTGLIGILNLARDINADELITDFLTYTNALDSNRDQSFSKTFPELYQILTNEK